MNSVRSVGIELNTPLTSEGFIKHVMTKSHKRRASYQISNCMEEDFLSAVPQGGPVFDFYAFSACGSLKFPYFVFSFKILFTVQFSGRCISVISQATGGFFFLSSHHIYINYQPRLNTFHLPIR